MVLFAASVVIFFVGWWASNEYMKHYPEKHDPKQIVIDEVAGMWLTLFFCVSIVGSYISYIIAFVLFRFFDAVKPWPISLADRKIKGGFGVMFDDLLAAIFSALSVIFYIFFYNDLLPTIFRTSKQYT